jgi:SAM-dependent methyltransferase
MALKQRILAALRRSSAYDVLRLVRDARAIRMNIKTFGYELAREAQLLRSDKILTSTDPGIQGLTSKASTQDDIESDWFVYWCQQINAAPTYHRKLWEFAFALQVLYDHDLLRADAMGIGFGCGEEPLPSYFASKGIYSTVTDLEPARVAELGWAKSEQHAKSRDSVYYDDIVTKDVFDKFVRHEFVDMNAIQKFETEYDFCWSICAMEHLGDIERGLRFVENAMAVLRPGGVAVHTTEFNFAEEEGATLDRGPTVLFQRSHFEKLVERLTASGHRVLAPDFSIGSQILDKFVDIPPYSVAEGGLFQQKIWRSGECAAHLKLSVAGIPATCFGIVVIKDGLRQ